jgi:TRAP-type C4-dicarboxylate transport system permease small subunit
VRGFLYRPERREPAVLRAIGDGVDVIIAVLGVALIVVMSANVFARAFLNPDIAWNTEFGEFTLVWATFLGGAAAARRGAHMCITELVAQVPPGLQRLINIATRLGILAILGLLVVSGTAIVQRTMDQQMSVLYWPIGLQYLAMPVGSALTFLFVAFETVVLLRGGTPIVEPLE